MGIYLGQLPPAEIARLKAELAETLIENFCYPRFFDSRTDSLRTRPVDRAKRQEVWLYLSSFDFTAWSRLDLMSPEFQNHVERLLIQFVQRNRSFFGEQGRRRMPDVRTLIGTSSTSVVQGLRNHLTGQKQGGRPFGSPRQVVSWKAPNVDGKPDLSWEQTSAAAMLLQQQMQEARGEARPAPTADGKAGTGAIRRVVPMKPTGKLSGDLRREDLPQIPTVATPAAVRGTNGSFPTPLVPKKTVALNPAASVEAPSPVRQSGPLAAPGEQSGVRRRLSEPLATPAESPGTKRKSGSLNSPTGTAGVPSPANVRPSANVAASSVPLATPSPSQTRSLSQPAALPDVGAGQREMMSIGEDDIAIFEQMRHQLLVWLRIEAIRAGLDISGQSPSQLMETLHQQARIDETRLQVVSTLLNLANQVIKTGLVSILDYKQGLMFYLMHTRN
jgi:hypothetical protein